MASADRQDSIATGMGWRNHVIACSPFLLFAIVLGMAMLWYWLLFNSSAIIAPFRMDIGDARGSISSPAEASYRMQFYLGTVGQCLSAIVAILVAFLCFRRHCRYLPGTTRILCCTAAIALLPVQVCAFVFFPEQHSKLTIAVYEVTMMEDERLTSGKMTFLNVKMALAVIAYWAAGVLAFACCAANYRLLRGTHSSLFLRRHDQSLNALLMCGAALLVCQIFLTGTWEHWMAEYFPDDLKAHAVKMGNNVQMGVGLFSSAALCAFYLPARLLLRNRAWRVAIRAVGKSNIKKSDAWLADHGLKAAVPTQLLKIFAMLSPAITGGLLEVLGKLNG